MKRRVTRIYVSAAVLLLFTLPPGCSTADRYEANPVGFVRDRSNAPRLRVMAVDYISQHRSDPGAAGINPQAAYKEIVWSAGEPPMVRAAVIDALLNDPDPDVVADAREMARLLLPREPSIEVIAAICHNAGQNGWTEFLPAMVRSYSRHLPAIPDADRPEREGIVQLADGKSVEEVAFEVFLNPPKLAAADGVDWTMRCRIDAWDLLARLDRDGSIRARLLAAAHPAADDSLLAAIGACRRDLRAIPISGEELTWLVSLRRPESKENAAWWSQATAAVASTNAPPDSLRLRHAEPIRWTSQNRPERLRMTRAELLSELSARTAGRRTNRRSLREGPTDGPRASELLERRAEELSWGDAISILVIDEAVRNGSTTATLFSQATADRADTTTEYGGLLFWRQSGGHESATAVMYPPRPAQRQGDERFVASDDMIAGGDLSLAHYHFHVQKESNSDYAGPSPGDLAYAAKQGRNCLVITGVGKGVMGVDWYNPDGVVIDLGEISAPAP